MGGIAAMKLLGRFKWHILLLCGLVGPTLFYVLFYGFMNHDNRENRELAENPLKMEDTTLANLPERLEAYYEDHLPLKNELTETKSKVALGFFGESTNPQVVVGKDGWLFFNGVEHGDPLGDYQGQLLFTEEEGAKIASYFNAANEYFQYRGIQLIIAIVPGKERVYPEYLPDAYGEPQYGRGAQMYDYLTLNCPGIPIVSETDLLKNYADTHEELIYFKTDTHWNHLGAYLAAKDILSYAGMELPEVSKEYLEEFDPGGGDLSDMLGLDPTTVADVDYKLTGPLDFPYLTKEGDVMSQVYYTSASDSGKKAFVFGDSMSIILSEELAGHFSELCYYRRWGNNTENYWEILERMRPDVLIYETSDRYLDQAGILANPLRIPGFYAQHPELEFGSAGPEVQ